MDDMRPAGARKGEAAFCIIYLVSISVMIIFLNRYFEEAAEVGRKVDAYRYSFGYMAAILLVGGDAFHLIPRIIYDIRGSLWKKDFLFGLGSLISSITMTLFYNVLIGMGDSMEFTRISFNFLVELGILLLTIVRIVILLFPQNKWFKNEPAPKWAVARNVPFALIGLLTIIGFINIMANNVNYPGLFYLIILACVLGSFIFYMPVALKGKENPKLGMLMIPKTVCYIVMVAVITFW